MHVITYGNSYITVTFCLIKIKSHLPNKSLPEIAGSICEIFALVILFALKFRSHCALVLRCCPTQIYGDKFQRSYTNDMKPYSHTGTQERVRCTNTVVLPKNPPERYKTLYLIFN